MDDDRDAKQQESFLDYLNFDFASLMTSGPNTDEDKTDTKNQSPEEQFDTEKVDAMIEVIDYYFGWHTHDTLKALLQKNLEQNFAHIMMTEVLGKYIEIPLPREALNELFPQLLPLFGPFNYTKGELEYVIEKSHGSVYVKSYFFGLYKDKPDLLKDIGTLFEQHGDAKYFVSYLNPVVEKPKKFNIKLAQEAFEVELQLSDTILAHLSSFISKQIDNYNPKEHYGLYFPTVQSSGWGKSRGAIELGKHHKNVVYGCLRSNDEGYPLRNSELVDFLKTLKSSADFEKLIVASWIIANLYALKKEEELKTSRGLSKKAPRHLFIYMGQSDSEGVYFQQYWNRVTYVTSHFLATNNKEGWEKAKVRYRYEQDQLSKISMKARQNQFTKLPNGRSVLSELVVVFDEARTLIECDVDAVSSFRLLRRAHFELRSRTCVLNFIDTLSSVTDFSPSRSMEPSFRGRYGLDLLDPFYEILAYNFPERTAEDTDITYRFKFGRFIWTSTYFRPNAYDVEAAIKYAMQKLSYNLNGKLLMENPEAVIAVCAIRFGIKDIMDHTLASKLVSSYMATGVFFGKDRIRMAVRYIPEPLLAEAACLLFHQNPNVTPVEGENDTPDDAPAVDSDKFPAGNAAPKHVGYSQENFKEKLKILFKNWTSGLISVGDFGELLGRIFLSLAFDYVKLNSMKGKDGPFYFSSPITVKEFLDVLIPMEYRRTYERTFGAPVFTPDPEFMKGKLILTQWVFMERLPALSFSQETLKKAYSLNVGFVFAINQIGVDFAVVILLENGTYTLLLIQKKRKKGIGFKEHCKAAGEPMRPINCLSSYYHEGKDYICRQDYVSPTPYMALYMDSGSRQVSSAHRRADGAAVEEEMAGLNLGDLLPKRIHIKRRATKEPPKESDAPTDHSDELYEESINLAKQFNHDYPCHAMVLGCDFPFLSDPLLQDLMKVCHDGQQDHLNARSRFRELRRMDPLSFDFVRECTCKNTCVPGLCPCPTACSYECSCNGKSCPRNTYKKC